MRRREEQSGQVLVIVAVWLIALIGAAALVLLAGSVEWQRNQLQQLSDQAALDAAMKIGVGCSAGSVTTVMTEADNFVATQRTRTGSLSIGAGSCAAGYTGTDTFSGNVTETIHYPYRTHQQQVEVVLTASLPISFGNYMGAANTNVTRRAVGVQLNSSTAAITANTLSCTGGQFNVTGSVIASNAITLSGGCAIYAHQRFDAASSTYSDLGNVSVYANGQTWVGGGGSCVAGGNSGSTNALCTDGFEVSGHNAVTCGAGGTSAFLSAGDAAINPNPCAAGSGAQPVPPVSTALPPEPNADPAAIATLRNSGGGALGSACTAAGVYPVIKAGATPVGTGLGPSPAAPDANGFYHFKPSCYGYLDLNSFSTGITNKQVGSRIGPVTHFVTPTLASPSTAGNLLVATLNCLTTPNRFQAPANWVQAGEVNQAGSGRTEIWYYPNAPATSSATWTINPANINCDAEMTEWNGAATVSPLDQSGSSLTASSTSATVSTSGATASRGELVITADGFSKGVGGQTFAPGAGWTGATADTANGFASEYRVDLPPGIDSETVTGNPATPWSLVIAAFKPAATNTGAVLDPGFYYFNGSGFAGGGGICLNGGTLLARDVTIEFVNAAGFSTGTCAPGGGAACTASTCSFGSDPCSVDACPGGPADPAGLGYEWFAAPCNSAPAGDVGCSGSTWCPTGDRACWNLLLWAPATNTGQIALTGTVEEAWTLGSVYWSGACSYTANGGSMISGTVYCGSLTISASAGAGTSLGGDYGISTALVEAVLVE
ncbi:MAG TPA: pilus assembly protein TadG-related protein [Candidatus Dormibacteraeota bacterium]|nr:pilus assembly protein TadG-related protein [Candidatus Dormibacteraeota bacterium]